MTERQFKHIRISDAVRSSILTGDLQSPLPEMGELSRRFGTSRVTMRNALLLLQEQGLVRIEHGSGTYINTSQETSVPESNSEDFRAALARYSHFLSSPNLPAEIKHRMIQIVDSQISLVNLLNSSKA